MRAGIVISKSRSARAGNMAKAGAWMVALVMKWFQTGWRMTRPKRNRNLFHSSSRTYSVMKAGMSVELVEDLTNTGPKSISVELSILVRQQFLKEELRLGGNDHARIVLFDNVTCLFNTPYLEML